MPPKTYKRGPVLPTRSQEKAEDEPQQQQINQILINPANLVHNFAVVSKIRTLLAILIGSICGILNISQVMAPIFFGLAQLAFTPLLALSMGNFKTYFNSLGEVAGGIAESIMMFVSSWLVCYNLVYTL